MMNLPTEGLRSFLNIIDKGSMVRASQEEGLTQSALSLRIARLERQLGHRLFSRERGRLSLTPAGSVVLGYARRMLEINDQAVAALNDEAKGPVRVGLVQDVADLLMEDVLARFAEWRPLEIQIGPTRKLLDALGRRDLDIVVGMGPPDDPSSIRRTSMLWIGKPSLAELETVPLAILEAPCQFREAAISALEADHRKFRVVLETPDVSTLRAAVDSGLAITCRTDLFQSSGPLESPALPALPHIGCILVTRPTPPPAVTALANLMRDALG